MSASEDKKANSALRFLGVSGIIATLGFAVLLGRYEAMIDDMITRVDKLQHETVVLITAVNEMNVQQYRLNNMEKRIDKLEGK